MDKNKKIIIGVVSIVLGISLVGIMKIIFSSSDGELSENDLNEFAITIPKVDEEKIEKASKMEIYDGETLDSIEMKYENAAKEITKLQNGSERLTAYAIDSLQQEENLNTEQEKLDKELKMILDMQREMESATYEDRSSSYGAQQYNVPTSASPSQITQFAQQASGQITSSIGNSIKQKNHFQGAGTSTDDNVLDLVPAETVDHGIIINGSTVAVRTKKRIKLENPLVIIPKDAILYGRVTFNGTDRLQIDVQSYKTNEKLYLLQMNIYDFDGREGIHLGNRSWTKIPPKIANDVYDYAYKKGTQGSTFGGGSDINLEEAKKIAILSGTKEMSKEIFDKRRVLMPRKYHLWINIKTER